VDEDRLQSAKVLVPSVKDGGDEDEGRVLVAELLGRPASVVGGLEKALGRRPADRIQLDEDLFFFALGRHRFVPSLDRLDQVVGPSAPDPFLSAAVLVLLAKDLLLSAKVVLLSPKAVFSSYGPRERRSASRPFLPI
jgi:hypothetical protein